MKKIMVLLYSFAKIDDVIEEIEKSIEATTEEIHLCFYQNKDVPDTLQSLMGVYLGEKIQKDVENTILKEYFRMKEEITYRIEKIAEDNDIEIINQLFKSYSRDKIYDYIEKHDIDYLVVNYFKNRYNSQKVYTDIEEQFLNNLDIEYKLFKHLN
jgi:hypothetical protein